MKKIVALLLLSMFTTLCLRAEVLFSDPLNYQNGLIETDGLWYAYSPASPHLDAFVTNDLLILNQANYDAVAAPTNGFNAGGQAVYASFTINVSSLPTTKGGYFCVFKDNTNNQVNRIFIDTENTVVPGTYRLGIANFATSVTSATNFPLDLATGITYQVVVSYDDNLGGTLQINPSSENDAFIYPTDTSTNTAQLGINISQIGFSQYTDQGVAAIGNVVVGTAFNDVDAAIAQAPVIGVQPQGTNVYSGDNTTLYTAASGIDVTYQWYSNNVALVDDGVTVIGSASNILYLNNLQNTATYNVVVSDSASGTTSSNAVVTVDSTPTPPFFTTQPVPQTNSLGSSVTLTATANGTGPITYQWYYAPTNSSTFTALSGQTSSTLTLTSVTFGESGSYYITATGDGTQNSATVSVSITPPPTVPISYLHSFLTNNVGGSFNIDGTSVFNIQGLVTSFAPFSASGKTYAEYYLQDGTGGIYVYIGGAGSNGVPAPGSLVSITGPVTVYDSQLEIDPTVSGGSASSNSVTVLPGTYPLPPSQLLNFTMEATNSLGAYGHSVQDALVTVTNAYIYSSKTGAAVTGNFATNAATTLYMFNAPYVAGAPYITLYVYASTGEATNFWGQPIPSFAHEVTGAMAQYNSTPELYPTRYADLLTATQMPFSVSATVTNGATTLSWPGLTGATYTVYSATNLLGPWTQTFGVGYYPSGVYTDTNSASAGFYRISTP